MGKNYKLLTDLSVSHSLKFSHQGSTLLLSLDNFLARDIVFNKKSWVLEINEGDTL